MDKNPRGEKAGHNQENKAPGHARLELSERVRYQEFFSVERVPDD